MNYFKEFIFCLILLLCSQNCYAEDWVIAKQDNKGNVQLDRDSINYYNNSLYYKIHYTVFSYGSTSKYAIVQSKGDSAGIVVSCSADNYAPCANTLNQKVATQFKPLTTDSFLYNANKKAWKEYNAVNKGFTPITDKKTLELLKPYVNSVENYIKTKWQLPNGKENKKAVIQFRIAYDGRLLNYKIINSSGDQDFDNAVLKTMQNIERFAPLPYGCNEDSIDITFTFEHKYRKFF